MYKDEPEPEDRRESARGGQEPIFSAGLIVSLRGRSFSSPERSANWPQSSSQDRARRRFRVETERSASSRASTDGRRQSETVRERAREVGGGASSSPASENEPDAGRARSGSVGARSGSVDQSPCVRRTNGKASDDRGFGDAEHQRRFVGGGGGGAGGVWARGGGVFRRACRGDATSAAELLGEGSGSTFAVMTGSGVQRSCPATRNIRICWDTK
jgi:hypothetical protein